MVPASMKLQTPECVLLQLLRLLLLVTQMEGVTPESTSPSLAPSAMPFNTSAPTTLPTSAATTTATTVSSSSLATTSHQSATATSQSTTPKPDACASAPCQNGATCILVLSGFSCLCPSGYIGTRCHERCSAGLFGEGCTLRCGLCYNFAACHHVNGSCPFGLCQPGYLTDKCDVGLAQSQGGTLSEEQRTWLGYGIGAGLAIALALGLSLLAARRLYLAPPHRPTCPSCPAVSGQGTDVQPSTYVEMYETVPAPLLPKRTKKHKTAHKKEKTAAQAASAAHLNKAVVCEGENFYFDMDGTSSNPPENPILADAHEHCEYENRQKEQDDANVYEVFDTERQSCAYANSAHTPSRQIQSFGKRPAK